jgi:hypothetical protein
MIKQKLKLLLSDQKLSQSRLVSSLFPRPRYIIPIGAKIKRGLAMSGVYSFDSESGEFGTHFRWETLCIYFRLLTERLHLWIEFAHDNE